ncbi:MAG: NADH-quinone oxidoreductase subunit M [Calditrichaeota bacterium]|nr:NADH-quinone oxidoreductase subunit M [Calditrichota bacterium]MCB9367610.1 NADH-quinone oxidoreductase subunit M [Calditrichota bacterium]
MTFPILSLILLCPVSAVLLMFMVPDGKDKMIKGISLTFSIIAMVLATIMYLSYNRAIGGFQFAEQYPWVPGLNSTYHLAVDGVGVTLVFLNAIVMLTGVITSFSIDFRVKEYFILFLLLVSGVFGSFMCMDLLLFFIFFEIAVLPMYLLIGIWGSTNREYAALKLTIMLLAGSGLVFVGLIITYFTSDIQTFDFFALRDQGGFTSSFQNIVYPLMFLGFGTLAAVFPLHNWSPDGHVAAPTAVSMLHAGVLMKLGAYGVLRYGIELFPDGASHWAPVAGVMAAGGVVYGALVAAQQTDLKYMIGYSSVSHMGLVMFGLAAATPLAISGAVYQMFSHGIMTALFFSAVGFFYEQTHSRNIFDYGGLARKVPWVATCFIIAGLAGVGLPGLAGFPAEFMIFVGAFERFPVLTLIAVPSLVFGAFYMLRVLQRVFFGPEAGKTPQVHDIGLFSGSARIILAGLIILFGVAPRLLSDIIAPYAAGLFK